MLVSHFARFAYFCVLTALTIAGFAETMLEENDQIEIEGYKMIRNDRNKEGGGILFAVKREFEGVTVEVNRENKTEESLWIVLGSRDKVRIGLVYAPQESRTQKKHLEAMYDRIKKEVQRAKANKEKIIIMGDLNCKIGEKIKGNGREVTKGGRLLLKLMEDEDMEVLNGLETCNGMWTRQENDKKSVLDYMIIQKSDIEKVSQVTIDENKLITPFRMVKKDGKVCTVYSDHNAMTCCIKWKDKNSIYEKRKKVMTKKGYEEFEKRISEMKVSKIWKKQGKLQVLYDEWNDCIMKEKMKCEKKERKKSNTKLMRKLITTKRKLKKDLSFIVDKHEQNMIKRRCKLISMHIVEENEKQYVKKIEATVESLRKEGGGVKETTFWEFKRKLERRKEDHMIATRDKNGNLVESRNGILEIYQEFYSNLFKTKEAKTKEEEEIEEGIQIKLKRIEEKANKQKPLDVKIERANN